MLTLHVFVIGPEQVEYAEKRSRVSEETSLVGAEMEPAHASVLPATPGRRDEIRVLRPRRRFRPDIEVDGAEAGGESFQF